MKRHAFIVLLGGAACALGTALLPDVSSSMPDIETYRALLPALATTGGMLIGISTPYRRIGLLHQKHRDYFGVDDPDVLVVAGASQQFNPTLDSSVIERARASDPEAARAEWDAEFRCECRHCCHHQRHQRETSAQGSPIFAHSAMLSSSPYAQSDRAARLGDPARQTLSYLTPACESP
jgi:hypothetical protein